MATLEYDGYIARIETDEENSGFHGRVINIGDVINFKGRSMAELKREFGNSYEGILRLLQRERRET